MATVMHVSKIGEVVIAASLQSLKLPSHPKCSLQRCFSLFFNKADGSHGSDGQQVGSVSIPSSAFLDNRM
ncbi:hypothetical protein RvY_09777 [Ramazzottius varieornatus]|uniref:Uncharacterized protein n=1 Tax=Ramazzottius varieornatus TaxID=947166 RepID=A0A1D1VJI3_RAMVA|nr:hypothetical protein RvY_09777 [Ramazzottius varieornatus]